MRFVVIADIHLGPEAYWHGVLRRVNGDAKKYMMDFVKAVNENIKPDFVVVLGDLVQDDTPENDKNNVSYIVKSFDKIDRPVHYAAGNHDTVNISEFEFAELLKVDRLYYSFDQGSLHFIVLFSRAAKHKDAVIGNEQLEWLKQDLDKTPLKTIVFIHAGLADQNLQGNPWFECSPEYALVINRKIVRGILEKSNKVVAVFNSHLHWDRKHVHNSIPYYTIQSLTENEDDKGIASEAYAIIDINDDKFSVKIEGNYPKQLESTNFTV